MKQIAPFAGLTAPSFGTRSAQLRRGLLRSGLTALAACGFAGQAHATGTAAGSIITNTATATYAGPAGPNTKVTSNTVSIRVDELLDVAVASRDAGSVAVQPGAVAQVLGFNVTNAGNGSEAFSLSSLGTLGGDDFDPSVTAIVLDTNGNGQYDAGVDTVYVSGVNDPVLAADQTKTVFLLSTIASTVTDGQKGKAQLKAVAVTGSGTPGTAFAGKGTGGGDAIVGATTAASTAFGTYSASAAVVTLTKSAVVADKYGGTRALPGSTITYSLKAVVTGSGSAANVVIGDAVPAGTTYAAGTLKLEGAALTDAADGDAGIATAAGVQVGLGTLAGGTSRTVAFSVRVN